MADNQRWTRRPPGSTWGDWGSDDERGRLNLLTPEKVLQGVAEVKTGKTFCLSLPLDYPGGAILSPRRHPPVLKPTMRGDKPNMNYPLRCDDPTATDVVCDDQVILTLQYPPNGTAWPMSGRCSMPMAMARQRTCSTTAIAPAGTSSALPTTMKKAT